MSLEEIVSNLKNQNTELKFQAIIQLMDQWYRYKDERIYDIFLNYYSNESNELICMTLIPLLIQIDPKKVLNDLELLYKKEEEFLQRVVILKSLIVLEEYPKIESVLTNLLDIEKDEWLLQEIDYSLTQIRKKMISTGNELGKYTNWIEEQYDKSLMNAICMICKLPLSKEKTICKCAVCGSYFHIHHLATWTKDNKKCPVCDRKIL